jgi:hypothetical protein
MSRGIRQREIAGSRRAIGHQAIAGTPAPAKLDVDSGGKVN